MFQNKNFSFLSLSQMFEASQNILLLCNANLYLVYVSKADMCQDPKKIRDPGPPGSRIRDHWGSWILYFHFLTGSWRSWTLSRQHCRGILGILDIGQKYFDGSRGSWIQLGQVIVGSCRSWVLHNNNTTVSLRSFTCNEILLSVSHIYSLI